MTPTIDDVIAAIPAWAGRAVGAEPIAAGLTNANWKVTVDGTPKGYPQFKGFDLYSSYPLGRYQR